MNLYMISLGGKVKGANIEVHDVQFTVAEHIDNSIDLLKASWYGEEEKLHMDSYTKIKGVDGYEVNISKEKSNENKKLFFVHLGGYDKYMTQELHKIAFFVAETPEEAKRKASKEILTFKEEGHIDQVVDVESCLLQRKDEKYYIKIEESKIDFDLSPDWFGYRRLDKE